MKSSNPPASVRKTSSFLESIGLSYDKVSGSTQKYLLDMSFDYGHSPEVISGSIIGMKFNNKINNNMTGGRIAFPIEYYGIETQNYMESQNNPTVIDSSNMVRAGIEYTGGGNKKHTDKGYLSMKDYKTLKQAYERKFLRKLKMSVDEQKKLMKSMNSDIEKAFINSVKENKFGKLTKSVLNKNLKKM